MRLLVDLASRRVDDQYLRALLACLADETGAGHTAPEVPTTSITLQFRAASRAASSAGAGRSSPNHTTPGAAGCRTRRNAAGVRPRAPSVLQALRRGQRCSQRSAGCPVQPDGVGVAGALVQVVDVLRHQHQRAGPAASEARQRVVAGVGLGPAHALAALGVPVPHALRLGAKTCFAGQFGGVEARPQAGQRVAEGWRCRFRHSCRRRSARTARPGGRAWPAGPRAPQAGAGRSPQASANVRRWRPDRRRCRGLETRAEAGRQLAATRDECRCTHGVDELQRATVEGCKSPAEDAADVGVSHRTQHAFLEAARRLVACANIRRSISSRCSGCCAATGYRLASPGHRCLPSSVQS